MTMDYTNIQYMFIKTVFRDMNMCSNDISDSIFVSEEQKRFFFENGYVKLDHFLEVDVLSELLEEIKNTYKYQFKMLGISGEFDKCMFELFEKDFESFSNCGKHNQHGLMSLYALGTSKRVVSLACELGVRKPFFATRPVIMQNSRKLARNDYNYMVPPHQDYGSMLGSKNSIVIWIPLVNVPNSMGPIEFVSGSHNSGMVGVGSVGAFSVVDTKGKEFSSVEMRLGDVLVFSSFLIHKSGEISDDSIRWSCHFRYNDISEDDFAKRKFNFNYIYKPIT